MDRKTILAVVISVVIIVGGMLLQPVLFPQKPVAPGTTQGSAPKPPAAESGQQAPPATPQPPAGAQVSSPAPAAAPGANTVVAPGKVVPLPQSAPPVTQPATVVRDTDLYSLTFSSNGG